jgi:hypothetical protein
VQFTQVKKEMGSSMTGSEKSRNIDDREQFRRYAEAALAGLDHIDLSYEAACNAAFKQAIEMMMMEDFFFDQYQIQACEQAIRNARAKHGIEEPSEPSKVF